MALRYDHSLAEVCIELKERWKAWDPKKTPSPFESTDFDKFTIRSAQIQEFLAQMLDDGGPFTLSKAKAMQEAYGFNEVKNCEVRYR